MSLYKKYLIYFFQKKSNLELAGNIGKGLRINHGQSSVIILNKSSDNLTVYQNVTCERNKNHTNKIDNSGLICFPTCGENVTIYSGAVVV